MFGRNRTRKEQTEYVPIKSSFVPPTTAVKYPKWTFAKVDESYWLVLDKTKKQFVSERAFLSWGKIPVLASLQSLSEYKSWGKIGFAPGTMIRSMSGQTYFITGSQPLEQERRLIETPDFYEKLGFNPYSAIIVSNEELEFHVEGESISAV